MIGKILLADSGTGHSAEMLKMLLEIPELKRASITILHVVPAQLNPESLTEKWEEGGKILATAVQSLGLDPTGVTTILRQGDPKTVVCQVADEVNADLIIMGSRGLKRLQSILQNSVSQYVFQLSSRAMLLVKDDIYVKRINRIMVALDKSEASQAALKMATYLLRDSPGGELLLAHVTKDEPLGPPESDPVLATALKLAKQQGIKARPFAAGGRPGPEICRLAAEANADLLVLGSPDRRPKIAKNFPDLDRLIGDSISDYIRVHADSPVLMVRTID
jgi:nucleotide-binding universal stress UspA family protein